MQTNQRTEDTTGNEKLKPLDIISNYDEYDLGENPYKFELPYEPIKDSKALPLDPDTIYDNLGDRSLKKTQSKERKIFLQAIANNDFDYICNVQNSLLETLIQNAENEEFKKVFNKNKLRFLRFISDLPKDNYSTFMRSLLNEDNYSYKNHFADWFNEDINNNDLNTRALCDVIIHLAENSLDFDTNK